VRDICSGSNALVFAFWRSGSCVSGQSPCAFRVAFRGTGMTPPVAVMYLFMPLQNGVTPAHIAAGHGRLPILQALLRDPRVNPGEAAHVRREVGATGLPGKRVRGQEGAPIQERPG